MWAALVGPQDSLSDYGTVGRGGFVYVAGFTDAEAEIAGLELQAMAGARLDGRLARAPVACDISTAAYTRLVVQVLAEAGDLEGLIGQVAGLGLQAEGFRVDVLRVPPKPALHTLETARRIADLIEGRPNLQGPVVEFAVVATEGWYAFGPIISRARRDWHDAGRRPHNFSNALPPRLARALVNCVAAAGDTLLDPCCGVGTVLIEACRVGARPVGMDIHPRRVQQARENLEFFNCAVPLHCADARKIEPAANLYDAAVVDLPYGHTSRADDRLYLEIVDAVAECARRMAVVTGADKSALWQRLGLAELAHVRVPATTLVRHVYLLAGRLSQ